MSTMARPGGVPAEAWWSPTDNEWILGEKDGEGRLVGVVRYWRPDGSLVNECEHALGKPHGRSLRFHETGEISQRCWFERGALHGLREWFMTDGVTTEKPRAAGLDARIWRGELDYVHGTVVAFRYYDREGREVGIDGAPLPPRPAGVPPNAQRSPKSTDWFVSSFSESGATVGLLRRWTDRGVLFSEEDHQGGAVVVTAYRRDDGSRRARYTLVAKRLSGEALAWRRDGTLSVRASFGAEPSVIEQLAADGQVVRRTEYGPAPGASGPNAEPTEEDLLVLDAIGEGDASAVDAAAALSPAGMGRAIARGWGGSGGRDADVARLMRRLVRKVAPPSLAEVLARLGLDRSPRWQTPLRLDGDVRALAADPAVDGDVLRDAVMAAGGPGAMLALADPGRAHGYLATRCSEDTLKLANLGLTELPAAIGRFRDVPRLYAEGNRLATVPDQVGDMFRLTWLNLAQNRITSLPRSLAWLPELRTLYLSKNELTAIPATVFELAGLHTLSIGDNQLTEVPEAIGELSELDDLSLYGNRLRDLPRSLARLPLTFLHLGDHQWAEPPAVLAEIHTLETLWIASSALERLPAEIVKLPRLKALMLWNSSVSEVPPELFEARHLRELRISDNPLPEGTIEQLKEALPDCTIY
jgi:Leucine-rich repeat (LRR) protein